MPAAFEKKFEEIGGIGALGKQFHPLSSSDIKSIEHASTGKIPDDYRVFLQKFGGIKILSASVLIVSDSGKEFDNLDILFGGPFEEDESIVHNIEIYRDRIPGTLIPIGEHWGNLICIGVKGKNTGKVFYWDHETEVAELVARDFTSFVSQLRLDDDVIDSPPGREASADDPFAHAGGIYQSPDSIVGADDSQIDLLEKNFGFTCPSDFRDFLRHYGGEEDIEFNHPVRFVSADSLPVGNAPNLLESIFGIDEISSSTSRFKPRLPASHLIIGRFLGSNQLCLGIGGGLEGKILFWKRDLPDRVFVIANSFEEFLSSLIDPQASKAGN